jgi:hypothetical protein
MPQRLAARSPAVSDSASRPVRSRFAPSPTGFLHIGGVRTALFSWLQARRHGGQFILRIEDTDRARSTEEAIQVILDGMEWLGLRADEGPVYQTDRFDRYDEIARQLLAQGNAYHCYCSKEELDEMRAAQMARREAALRRPLPRSQGTETRRAPGAPLPHARRGRGRGGRQGLRPRRVRQSRAGRPGAAALRRRADLQLLGGGGRHGHGHHPRRARRRSPEQHAAADQRLPRARRRAAGIRARAHDPRSRRREAVQAPRRSERAAVPPGGLPARGPAQLPRAARLVARRPGDLLHPGNDRTVRHRRRQQVRLELQSREAHVA